jgi:hypothetical protein
MSMPLSTSTEPQPAWGIATLFPAQGSWSIDEYLDLTDSTNRLVEFTNGKVEILQLPTMTHQLIIDYVFTLIKAFVNEQSLGRVLFAALRVKWMRPNSANPTSSISVKSAANMPRTAIGRQRI